MKKYFVAIIFITICNLCYAQNYIWHTDILGEDFKVTSIPLANSYDGKCKASLVFRPSVQPSNRAIIYIHGFNDYFFQKEMADTFSNASFNFFAIDLRRHGRSLENWQHPCDIRNISDYFEEINAAIDIIKNLGNNDITLIGHSTGGLTSALYALRNNNNSDINRVILNSPFLEWNMNSTYRNFLIPLIGFWSNFSKSTKISQNDCNGYAQSLLKTYHGEWDYNTEWKKTYSPDVTVAWIKSIDSAQSDLMKNGKKITIPILVLISDNKVDACEWNPDFQSGDAVLDPEMIKRCSAKLGQNTTIIEIKNGIHDLVLSSLDVRNIVYKNMLNFITNN